MKRKSIRLLLAPFSFVFGWCMQRRADLYRIGILRAVRYPCRVISIGNLTLGGTGKTPTVLSLAKNFLARRERVCVVTRGYRRESRGLVVVSDQRDLLTDLKSAGDEALFLARQAKGCPVIASADRRAGIEAALKFFDAQVVLLDDGFQHLAVARDLDIVLIDATDPFGNGLVFPGGGLREPVRNISRAGAILLTRTDQADPSPLIRRMATIARSIPIFYSSFTPRALIRVGNGEERPPSELKGRPVFLFSGIGNPRSFRKTVEGLGAKILGEKIFRDHFDYPPGWERSLPAASKEAEILLTTEKDAIKIQGGKDCWALSIELSEVEERKSWEEKVYGVR